MFSQQTELLRSAVVRASQLTNDYFCRLRAGEAIAQSQTEELDSRTVATLADLESERQMIAMVAATLPGSAHLGEETGFVDGCAPRLVVDGIDGSLLFTRGMIGGWGIIAALEENGQPLTSVVALPATEEVLVVERCAGCWYGNLKSNALRRIQVLQVSALEGALVGMWRSDGPRDTLNHEPFSSIRARCVEASNMLCGVRTMFAVAHGCLQAIAVPYHKYWDFLPWRLIFPELGGVFEAYRLDDWSTPVTAEQFTMVRGPCDKFNVLGAVTLALFNELKTLAVATTRK